MKNLNLGFLLLINQPKTNFENIPPPEWNTLSSLDEINMDMFICLLLSENQTPEIIKINSRYIGMVEDILMYESGHEKERSLMNAWDNWLESLEQILTKKQYDLFLSMNHDALWNLQMNKIYK